MKNQGAAGFECRNGIVNFKLLGEVLIVNGIFQNSSVYIKCIYTLICSII